MGISTKASYEQHITLLEGTGAADAVYGFGIIEYKRPGVIAIPSECRAAVDKLSKYLVGKARELAPTKPLEPIKKTIGIGLDARKVFYLRYASSENRAKFFQPVSLETQLQFFKPEGPQKGRVPSGWPHPDRRGQHGLAALLAAVLQPASA